MGLHALVALAVAGGSNAGCSGGKVLTLDLVTGQEADAMTLAPAVVEVGVSLLSPEGELVAAALSAPGGSFDLGDEVPTDIPLRVEVEGRSVTGAVVLRGRSIDVVLGNLEGTLPVFCQRLGSWARPEGQLARAHVGSPAGVLVERYLLSTGGESAAGTEGPADEQESDAFDLLSWSGAVGDRLPVAARSLVARGEQMILVGDDAAWAVDFLTGERTELSLPLGLPSFGDVAGGLVVDLPDGRSFVVGATRPAGPSRYVLEIGADGALAARTTTIEREGAAAVYVDGRGLFVAGGSAEEPGAELLPVGGTVFAPLAFDADPTVGAAAVALDGGTVVLVGGAAPLGMPASARRFDLLCGSGCVPTSLPSADLPVALTGSRAFRTPSGRVLALGAEPTGAQRSFLVALTGDGAASELALRTPRRGATAVAAPNGTLALLGGVTLDGDPALDVELFFPE